MPTHTTTRLAVLLAALVSSAASGAAKAECALQQPALTPIKYIATQDFNGTLSLSVVCDTASALQQYTLNVSALGGRFDQASGAFVVGAVGRADSVLQVQIANASPALGGSAAQTVYTGSQKFDFKFVVPAGQWTARGTTFTSLNFELHPFTAGATAPGINTGQSLP
jgi:hypothetical protein